MKKFLIFMGWLLCSMNVLASNDNTQKDEPPVVVSPKTSPHVQIANSAADQKLIKQLFKHVKYKNFQQHTKLKVFKLDDSQ